MASFTLGPDSRFRPGTVLSCYPVNSAGRQLAAAITTAVVAADSTTTFTGLQEGTRYSAGPAGTGPYTVFWTNDPAPNTVNVALAGDTVDTGQHFRLIMFSNGTTRAIPFSTPDPSAPTSLHASAKLSSVRLTWTAATGAAQYAIFRNGTQIATSAVASYRDINIAVGSTYGYQVQTLDAYGQRSSLTATVTAFIDPASNSAPTVTVKAWPPTFPSNGKTFLRVNASDVDAQTLALALSVDSGNLSATSDPAIWIYTP